MGVVELQLGLLDLAHLGHKGLQARGALGCRLDTCGCQARAHRVAGAGQGRASPTSAMLPACTASMDGVMGGGSAPALRPAQSSPLKKGCAITWWG